MDDTTCLRHRIRVNSGITGKSIRAAQSNTTAEQNVIATPNEPSRSYRASLIRD